jgi:hypothetical protein
VHLAMQMGLSQCLGNTKGVGPYLGALRCVPTLEDADRRVLVDGSGYRLATALGGAVELVLALG